ncbi:MAG: insulinase family protein, partial [Salinimicrobium sp.]
LSDWSDGILLEGEEIEKERGVVLAEWLSKQSPRRDSSLIFLKALLNESRYTDRTVIGDTATLKSFNHQQLKDFYEKWYDPSLMAVAIAGDVNVAAVEKSLIEEFSGQGTSRPHLKNYEIADFKTDKVSIHTDQWAKKTELDVIQLIPPFRDIQTEDDYLDYLTRNLMSRLISERFSNLSFDNPPYIEAGISIGNFLPAKAVHIASVEVDNDSIKKGLEQFFQDSQQIYRYGFTTAEIDKIKKSYLQNMEEEVSKKEDPSPGLMIQEIHKDFFNNNIIISKESELDLLKKYLPQLDSVAFVKAINAYNQPKATHFLLRANEQDNDKLPTETEVLNIARKSREAPMERYSHKIIVPDQLLSTIPKAGTILEEKEISEIGATVLTLSNGLRVVYKKTDLDKDNLILSGFRKGGLYALDSIDYINGTFSIPIIGLSGYGEFSREALSEYLSGSSASAILLADKTRTGFYASSDIKDKEELFQLLYLKWTQPRVDPDLYQQVKQRSIRSMEEEDPSAAAKFGRELKYLLLGENYITRRMTPEDVELNLDKDALIDSYKHFFGSAEGYMVSVISDESLEDLKPLILQYLGGLPSGPKDLNYRYKNDHPVITENIEMIRRTGESPRASVSLIFQEKEEIDNLQALELRNKMVKDVLKSVLLKRLREEMGAVYSVSVSASSTVVPSHVSRQTISFVCEPGRAEELVSVTKKIINNLVNGTLNFSEDLQKTKTNYIKVNELLSQRNTFWTSAIRDHFFEDIASWEYVTDYQEKVGAISQDQVKAALKKYFLETPMIKAILYPSEEESKSL